MAQHNAPKGMCDGKNLTVWYCELLYFLSKSSCEILNWQASRRVSQAIGLPAGCVLQPPGWQTTGSFSRIVPADSCNLYQALCDSEVEAIQGNMASH